MTAKAGRKPDESDEDIKAALAAVIDAETSPVATAGDVAERLSINRDATRKRLNALANRREVGTREVGRGRCYWLLPEERQARLSEVEDVDEQADDVDDDQREVDAADELLSLVDEIDPPGQSEEKVEARREALRAVLRYAIDNGHITRKVAKEEIYPEHPAMYVRGDDPAQSWFKNWIYKGLCEVAERSDRLPVAGTDGLWSPDLS